MLICIHCSAFVCCSICAADDITCQLATCPHLAQKQLVACEAAELTPSQQLPATPENGLIVSNRVRSGQLRELRLVGEEGPQQKIADFISGLSEQRLDPDWDYNHPSTPTCEPLGTVSGTCA